MKWRFFKKTPKKPKPIRIHVGLTGGVRLVDIDAFFEQEEVQRQLKIMREADIVGKKLDQGARFPKKRPKNST